MIIFGIKSIQIKITSITKIFALFAQKKSHAGSFHIKSVINSL